MPWEVNLKGRALSGGAFHPNVSVTLFNDSVHRGKSESLAFAAFFGGKEWLKDMRKGSRVHPRSSVGLRQKGLVSFFLSSVVPFLPLGDVLICGFLLFILP